MHYKAAPSEHDCFAAVEFGFEPATLEWVCTPTQKQAQAVLTVDGVRVALEFHPRRLDGYKATVAGFRSEIYTREELHDAIEAYVAKVKRASRPRAMRVEANGALMFNQRVLPLVEDGYIIQHCFSVNRNGMCREVYILVLEVINGE